MNKKSNMENNFENKMENLTPPNTDFVKHQDVLKIGLLNARKSARIGIIFILIPIVLIVTVCVKFMLLSHWGFFANFEAFVSKQDQTGLFNWVHLLFIAFPILAIIINLLAITHFYISKQTKELIISIRYQFKNMIVLLVGAILILGVFIYVMFLNKP
jgi:hypothetical protein